MQIVYASAGSVLQQKSEHLAEICSGWLRRLSLNGKKLVIYERTLESDPHNYELDREKVIGGRWLHCLGAEGETIEPLSYRIFAKDYSTIVIEMLPNNWAEPSSEMFERVIVHEFTSQIQHED